MKPILALTLLLALAGCGPQGNGAHKAGKARAETPAVDPSGSVPAAYEAFPADVRASIYQSDLLTQKCSGFRRRDEQACAARDALSKDLLAKGWCFGGADDPASAHWVLCAEDYPGGESWVASPKDEDALPPAQ